MSDEAARDWEAYQAILDLWKQENPIKTTKLQVLLAVNGGLLTVVSITGGFCPDNWAIYLTGAVLSGVWTLSIGRTTLYQQYWKHKLDALAKRYPDDPRFSVRDVASVKDKPKPFLRAVGGVSSKYYLLGAPILLSLAWLLALIVAAARS
jgi:hypothetical protein